MRDKALQNNLKGFYKKFPDINENNVAAYVLPYYSGYNLRCRVLIKRTVLETLY